MSSSKNTESNVGDVKHYGSRFHVSCRPQLLILYNMFLNLMKGSIRFGLVWFYCILFTTV